MVKVTWLSLILVAIYLCIAFISYLFCWQADQDIARNMGLAEIFNPAVKVDNALGRLGALLSHFFFYKTFGISSFAFIALFVFVGMKLINRAWEIPLRPITQAVFMAAFLGSIIAGYLFSDIGFPWGGTFGHYSSDWLISFIGVIGTGIFLVFAIVALLVYFFDPDPEEFLPDLEFTWPQFSLFRGFATSTAGSAAKAPKRKKKKKSFGLSGIGKKVKDKLNPTLTKDEVDEFEEYEEEEEEIEYDEDGNEIIYEDEEYEDEEEDDEEEEYEDEEEDDDEDEEEEEEEDEEDEEQSEVWEDEDGGLLMHIQSADEKPVIEDDTPALKEDTTNQLTHARGDYDPTADLPDYKFPDVTILEQYDANEVEIDKEELQMNKRKIVETLSNYKIEIVKISATVSPTITLYEIVPAPGIKISKSETYKMILP